MQNRDLQTVLAKTQKECQEKLSAALEQAGKVDAHKADQYTVGQWAKAKGRVKRYEDMKVLSLSAKTIRGLYGVLPMFYLELAAGLKRGELVVLLRDDLGLEKQTLTVSKSAGRINGEVKVTQPKTANSVRIVYLPKETVDLLIQEHAKHPGTPSCFPLQ